MSTVTIPSQNNINRTSGTLCLGVSRPEAVISPEVLLRTGDFKLIAESDALVLEIGQSNPIRLEMPTTTFMDEQTIDEYTDIALGGGVVMDEMYFVSEMQVFDAINTYVIWTWIGNNHRLVAVNVEREAISSMTFENVAATGEFGLIDLATVPFWTGHYRSLRIYMTDMLYNEKSLAEVARFVDNESLAFHADYTKPQHYEIAPVVETTMVPHDQSPVLVENADGPMTRQFFFDPETGIYSKTNSEKLLYKGEDELFLSFGDLNPQFKVLLIFEDGETFTARCTTNFDVGLQPLLSNDDVGETVVFNDLKQVSQFVYYNDATFADNIVYPDFSDEQKALFYGQYMTVVYQLANSYNIEYNEDTAYDSLRVNLVTHNSQPVTVIQEGNRFSNQYLAREIELNPLVNAQHTGFVYIDKAEQKTNAFRLNISSAYISANGIDTADFIVEAIDAEGNEVLSPYIDVFVFNANGQKSDIYGMIYPIINEDTMKARNTSGRCYFKYKAPLIHEKDNPYTQKITLVAYDRKYNIGAQFPLILKPINETEFRTEHNHTFEPYPEAILPFEYFARYYKRNISQDSAVQLMDSDNDGVLTKTDFNHFMISQKDRSLVQSWQYQIKESEVF